MSSENPLRIDARSVIVLFPKSVRVRYRLELACRSNKRIPHQLTSTAALNDQERAIAEVAAKARQHDALTDHTLLGPPVVSVGISCRCRGRGFVHWIGHPTVADISKWWDHHQISDIHQQWEYEADWLNEVANTLTAGFKGSPP